MKAEIPALIHMDDHLLVVTKPPGMNTHASQKYGNAGMYEWLRDRHPDLAQLAIVHRLDKGTSGVLVFARSPEANRALVQQFEDRQVNKRYLFLTDRAVPDGETEIRSYIERDGARYRSATEGEGRTHAHTRFYSVGTHALGTVVEARPLTGRTHQVRIHAADAGFPVLGDPLYGGTEAARLFLHATAITFEHPASGESLTLASEPEWGKDPTLGLRHALVSKSDTFYRLIHGATDGWPGLSVDRLGSCLLAQSESPLTQEERGRMGELMQALDATHLYHKNLDRQVAEQNPEDLHPILIQGEEHDDTFFVKENGLNFSMNLAAGCSTGLFGDQRENRKRFLTGYVTKDFPLSLGEGKEVLNTFAYTCGFSVCAAKGGARVTSVDLSRKQLQWGEENFGLNDLDPTEHDFIYGDVFDWLKRFKKKGRSFHAIILDPPTFSRSKESGVFQATRDYERLVIATLDVLAQDGVLLACTNAARFAPEEFVETVEEAVQRGGRNITTSFFAPQGGDFPISRDTPLHLKSLWLRIA